MPVVPPARSAKIQFCEGHVATWIANAVAMGSSSTAISAWQTKVVAARAAMTAQTEAAGAAKSATLNLTVALDALDAATSDIIKQVRLKASTGGDPIYALADIPVPATPTTPGEPGTPCDFKIALKNNGALGFSWSCKNPKTSTGTTYMIYRSLDGGPQVQIGATGGRKYLDNTVPAGTVKATYALQGTRTNSQGEWAEFNVNFAIANGGALVVSMSPATTRRAA